MKINGQDIKFLATLGSWHDNGFLWGTAIIDEEETSFRIHVSEIAKMLGDFNFNIDFGHGDKRRKHIHLTVDASVYGDNCEVTEETRELLL